jgi:glycosyltransferase involved in cell wall biosynthesis
MSQSLVSILIPCYNSEKWLSETLESALAQTWQNTEIIVVDDGSTDGSLAIAKQFESFKVKIINQHNQGASATRNRALKESQGDFIQYLDADDLLAADKIELQLKLLGFNQDSNYVASGEWARFYKLPSEAVFMPQPLWSDMLPVEWLVTAWEENLMMPDASWLVPRCMADLAGSWNENLSLNDDGEYFCRVILASQEVKFCVGAKSYYRSGNPNSVSASQSRKAWKSAFLALELCTDNLLSKENSDRTRHACTTVLQRNIYAVYPRFPELLSNIALRVEYLGGSNLELEGSPMLKFTEKFFGWKVAKEIQEVRRYVLNCNQLYCL